MTAFNKVLTAEQEAEKTIAAAKEEVAEAIAAARKEQKTRLESEGQKLKEAAETELAKHKAHVGELVQKIETDVTNQVTATEQKFVTHKDDLKAVLKQSFQ